MFPFFGINNSNKTLYQTLTIYSIDTLGIDLLNSKKMYSYLPMQLGWIELENRDICSFLCFKRE